MRLTVRELRYMIERSMQDRNMQRSEVFGGIEYNPEGETFQDRWGHPLPSEPETMDPTAVRDWLDSNGIDEIGVRGRKMSPDHFIRFIDFMKSNGQKNIPIIRGSESGESTKTGDIPVVKGMPTKQRRQFRAEV